MEQALESAQLVDKLGFKRLWFAEHHNTINLASMATSNLIGLAAQVTESIRVGSGVIMLPNHSSLQVAEYFCTIALLFPDRIYFVLVLAPGTDVQTAKQIS